MSDLKEIEIRHSHDRLRDAIFIIGAVLLTALSIGSVTRKAAGHVAQKEWGVSMVPYEDPDATTQR